MTSLRVAVLLALAYTGMAFAADQRPNLLVLDLEPRGVGLPEAQAATGSVVRGLRQLEVFQVLSSDDVRQLLALERTRQLSGARAESSVGQLGVALNASNAVVGSVTRVGGKLQVEIRLLDASTQKVLAQKSLNQATIEQVANQLPGLAQELMAPLLREQQGFLVVKSKEEAAEVLVDDTLVGSTPLKASIDLSRGTHRLTVRKDGFIAQTRSVRIEPKQTTVEEVKLQPSADYAKIYKDKYGKIRVGAWIATGVAVAGITTAIVMNASANSEYNDQFKPRQAWLQGAAGTGPQTEAAGHRQQPHRERGVGQLHRERRRRLQAVRRGHEEQRAGEAVHRHRLGGGGRRLGRGRDLAVAQRQGSEPLRRRGRRGEPESAGRDDPGTRRAILNRHLSTALGVALHPGFPQ